MYYIMRKSDYVMHKLLRYAKKVSRYAVSITLWGNYYVMWRHHVDDACVSSGKEESSVGGKYAPRDVEEADTHITIYVALSIEECT